MGVCCEGRFLPPPPPHPAVGVWFLVVSSPEFGSEQARTAFLTVILWPACYLRIMGGDLWLFCWGGGSAFVRAKEGLRKKHTLIS